MTWVPAIVCQYRIHSWNFSRSVKKHYQAVFAVLDKLFARADLPTDLCKRRGELYAQVRLAEAGRLYGAGDIDDAKASLQLAVNLDHNLLAIGDERLCDAIVGWQKSAWLDNKTRFLKTVFANLPTGIYFSPSQQRKVYANAAKAKFYDDFGLGYDWEVVRMWMTIARQEPSWLLNRGGWSILLQSLGFKARRSRSDSEGL